jgi:TonB family protein
VDAPNAPSKPSGVATVIAACLPLPMVIAGIALAFISAGDKPATLLQEAGMFGPLTMLAAGFATIALTALLIVAGLGIRVPTAVALLVAALPALAGVGGMAVGLRRMFAAVASVEPSMKIIIVTAGTGEAAVSAYLGSVLSSDLFAAAALGLAIAALGQPAPRRSPLGIAIGAALGLVLTAGALVPLVSAHLPTGSLMVALAGLSAIIAMAAGAFAAGPDAPRVRAPALAATSASAAALSVLLACFGVEFGTLMRAFTAIPRVDPADRATILGLAASELLASRHAVQISLFAGVLAAAGVAGWAATRLGFERVPKVGAVAVSLVAAAVVGLTAHQMTAATIPFVELSRPPWKDLPGFQPVSVSTSHEASGSFGASPEVVVGLDRVLHSGVTDERGRARVAFDARAGSELIKSTLDPLAKSGVDSIALLGVSAPSHLSPEAVRLREELPWLEALWAPVQGVQANLPNQSLNSDEDGTLWHGTVDANGEVDLSPRSGSRAAPRHVGSAEDASPNDLPGTREPKPYAYLQIAPAATAGSVVRAVCALDKQGFRPVLVTGELPGHPERPASDVFANLLRGGSPTSLFGNGDPASDSTNHSIVNVFGPDGLGLAPSEPPVKGLLDKEAIREVVHRHTNEIRYCYEKALANAPDLMGKISVKFAIGPSGKVQSVSVESSLMKSPEVEECVVKRVRTWEFPKPKGGGVVSVTYPFVFQSAGQ